MHVPSEYQDLTFNKLLVYYEAKGITLSRRTFKKNLGFLTEDGRYNVMAQLLSDNSHIPIRFSLFNGNDKTSIMYSVREFGNTCLLYSLDDVLNYGDILNIPQADDENAYDTEKNAYDNKEKKVIIACKSPKTILEIMDILGYKDRRSAGIILNSLIERGIIAMTIPDKPKSKNQKYITIV